MVRVGLVGCGRVAEHHLRFLRGMQNIEIAGVADVNTEAARRLADKFEIHDVYGSLEDLLKSGCVDVLHVTTPPEFHLTQAALALDAGAHVLVEKPVVIRSGEIRELLSRAEEKGVTLCPNFIQLFNPVMQQAIRLIRSGKLGRVVFCESHLGVDPNLPEFREVRGMHWSFSLPGGIFHNYVTHPLYMILYWIGAPEQVQVASKSLGYLPQYLTDHLEVMIEGSQGSGYLRVSCASRPHQYYTHVYCERGSVRIDFNTLSLLVEKEGGLPRFVERGLTNFRRGGQLLTSAVRNAVDHLRGRLVPYQGLQILLQQYYECIRNGKHAPVPAWLTEAVTEMEQKILAEAGKVRLDLRPRIPAATAATQPGRVLVTGAAGYVGREIVRQLLEKGYSVRAFVRPLNHTEDLERLGVEIYYGDVRDLEVLNQAAESVDVIVHAAAALKGSRQMMLDSAIEGTRNVARVSQDLNIRRVIYLSSQSVYDYNALPWHGMITEDSPLESRSELRGAYSEAKCRAEEVARAQLTQRPDTWTILRPSVVFGNGSDVLSLVGKRVGNLLICLSSPRKQLRLIHVCDVARAVINCIENRGTAGRVFNISHFDSTTVAEWVAKAGDSKPHVIYVPYWLMRAGVAGVNSFFRLIGKPRRIHKRGVVYLYKSVHVKSEAFHRVTGWMPEASLSEQVASDHGHPEP